MSFWLSRAFLRSQLPLSFFSRKNNARHATEILWKPDNSITFSQATERASLAHSTLTHRSRRWGAFLFFPITINSVSFINWLERKINRLWKECDKKLARINGKKFEKTRDAVNHTTTHTWRWACLGWTLNAYIEPDRLSSLAFCFEMWNVKHHVFRQGLHTFCFLCENFHPNSNARSVTPSERMNEKEFYPRYRFV